MNRKTFAFVGGIVGLVTFLCVALLPSIVYGGFAGVALSSTIIGEPISGQLLSKVLIVAGMLIGVLSVGGLFTVVGAALSSTIYHLTSKRVPDRIEA
jgi:hypothetical protein